MEQVDGLAESAQMERRVVRKKNYHETAVLNHIAREGECVRLLRVVRKIISVQGNNRLLSASDFNPIGITAEVQTAVVRHHFADVKVVLGRSFGNGALTGRALRNRAVSDRTFIAFCFLILAAS